MRPHHCYQQHTIGILPLNKSIVSVSGPDLILLNYPNIHRSQCHCVKHHPAPHKLFIQCLSNTTNIHQRNNCIMEFPVC